MSKHKHSPGPWMRSGYGFNILANNGEGRSVAETTVERNPAFKHLECPSDERIANAALISLAPEMLEALEAQEAVDEHCANCEDCSDGAFPELCEEGFPIADHARLLRRAVLAKYAELAGEAL